ncbi:MAG: beta-propeller domain-containing protein [Roseburia sp.]
MNEQEMLRQLKEAAKEVPVPDAIKPDQIENMLQNRQTEKKQKRGRIMRFSRWVAAAALLLVCGTAVYAVTGGIFSNKSAELSYEYSMDMAEVSGVESEYESGYDSVNVAYLGDMYTQAQSYEEIYTHLNSMQYNYGYRGDPTEGAMEEEILNDSIQSTPSIQHAAFDTAKEESVASDDYSTTNLQTEGVDEGDLMKTDGHYIYRIIGEEGRLVITDVSGKEPKEVASFCPAGLQEDDLLKELYVADDRLVVIAQRRDTSLQTDAAEIGEDVAMVDVYYVDSQCETVMVTLDISDPASPTEIGVYQQDGSYFTSRRVESVMYLFTENYNLDINAGNSGDVTEILPKVQGEKIACDDIYLAEYCSKGLVMSSVDLAAPEQTVDSKMILDYGAQIYVGETTAYLYKYNYDQGVYTDIAAFTLKDGIIMPVNAYSVPGDVLDTFAINEKDGYLRVLTTDYSAGDEVENALYILDSDMKLCGSLTGIAPGEQIYAARFIGDMGYFVTYENTDPLFSVDLSDPENPVLVGELSVTGFSDYLHPWDEEHLLGIGYETDPDTGNRLGLKLSMFNISDPANVYEEAKCVLKDTDSGVVLGSPALDDYKSVLVSSEKNIIGLMLLDYSQGNAGVYTVFTYENGAFSCMDERELSEGAYQRNLYGAYWNTCRSLYVGDRIYVMDGSELLSLDITW